MSRILLSAYACEPEKGSEPGVGWMWATRLADSGHEVWVITRTRNRAAIENAGRSPHRDLHFVYCDLGRWAQRWKRLPGGIYLYYGLWQWLAFLSARKLTCARRFDVVHHVTFVGLRGPSFMGWLPVPFYFGPVSGGESVPRRLRLSMSRSARRFEGLRDVANFFVGLDPLMRMAFRRAQRIYLTSAESLRLIPAPYRDKCSVQLGVGLTPTQLGFCSRRLPISNRMFRCLYVGRLLEWKGLDLALQALRQLCDEGVEVRLTIVGEGPAEARLKAKAEALGIADRVEWLPWLVHEEAQHCYHRHHAFLFPSLRDSGGVAVLEALAHGVPVVCLDCGGPGAIVNNRCGRVVPTFGQTEAEVVRGLTAAIRELATNRGLLEQLSVSARRKAWGFEFGQVVANIHPGEAVS